MEDYHLLGGALSINHVDIEGGGGKGLAKTTILLHKPYFVKWSKKGEGIKNVKRLSHGLWMPPGGMGGV